MNIIFFLNRDLESNFSYYLLRPALQGHHVRIFLSESVGGKKTKAKDLRLLESFERDRFFKLPTYKNRENTKADFEFFDEYFSSVPIDLCQNVNDPKFVAEIKSFAPDLFISIRFGKIFRDEIIGVPRLGILNLHSGILPDFRGILGTLHALREGRNEVGCTLHFIDNSSIDTGRIIDIAYLPVDLNHSLFWHILNLYPLGCLMIIKTLNLFEDGLEVPTRVQDLRAGQYFSLPEEHHFDELKRRGFEIIKEQEYDEFLCETILIS